MTQLWMGHAMSSPKTNSFLFCHKLFEKVNFTIFWLYLFNIISGTIQNLNQEVIVLHVIIIKQSYS